MGCDVTDLRNRLIEFEGCFNFRDLGGWRTTDGRTVAWGRLYRADSVHRMTESDATRARQELGLRTVLDLRSELEISYGGLGLLAEAGTARHHLPLSSRRGQPIVIDGTSAAPSADRSPDTMVANYLAIMEASSDLIVDAVSALATDRGLPAVFFCAAGKDRTGVLSAVVLGALGVRDEDIMADYVLTTDSIDRIITRFAADENSPAIYRDNPPSHFAPVAETMQRVLRDVRHRYGSFGEYLVSKGLAETALSGLNEALLRA